MLYIKGRHHEYAIIAIVGDTFSNLVNSSLGSQNASHVSFDRYARAKDIIGRKSDYFRVYIIVLY